MSEQLAAALRHFLSEIDLILNDRETSVPGEDVTVGPLRGTTIYFSAKLVEQCFDNKVPSEWNAWRELLFITDENRPAKLSKLQVHEAYKKLEILQQWADKTLDRLEARAAKEYDLRIAQELKAEVKAQWESSSISVLESFRDCAVVIMEIASLAHARAKANFNVEMPVFHAVAEHFHKLERHLQIAKEIWASTPVAGYLTRPERVAVNEARRCRLDGCCFHEVAINVAEFLYVGCTSGPMTCSEFTRFLRFHTAQGDFVTDYLRSMVADIRVESQSAIEKRKSEARDTTATSEPTSELPIEPPPPVERKPDQVGRIGIGENEESEQAERDNAKKPAGRMPDNPDVRDLCHLLNKDREKIASGKIYPIDIARKLTGEIAGSDPKAQSLMRQARRFDHLWK